MVIARCLQFTAEVLLIVFTGDSSDKSHAKPVPAKCSITEVSNLGQLPAQVLLIDLRGLELSLSGTTVCNLADLPESLNKLPTT